MLSNDGGYSVLCPCDGDSRLLRAMTGVFYGTTFSGGDFRLGTVFRLQPPQTPTMLGTRIVGGIVQVSFAGLSNYNYQIIRSPDLIQWTTLATVVMPPQGVYTNEDSAPPDSAAYYRAIWLP